MNTSEVCQRFVRNPRNRAKGSSIYYEDDMIYSYGSHFQLGLRLGDLIFMNADKRSSSTSQHQNELNRATHYEAIAIPLSSVPFPLFEELRSGKTILLDRIKDQNESGSVKESTPIGGGWTIEWDYDDATPPQKAEWKAHRPGSCLFRRKNEDPDKSLCSYYLCSVDENQYFTCLLPERCDTVGEALELLKPEQVSNAEIQGVNVLRQGEWYFIPTNLKTEEITRPTLKGKQCDDFIETLQESGLVDTSIQPGNNRHEIKDFRVMRTNTYGGGPETSPVFCRGAVVRHRTSRGKATGEHKALELDPTIWYQVYRNLAVVSWSAAGGFD